MKSIFHGLQKTQIMNNYRLCSSVVFVLLFITINKVFPQNNGWNAPFIKVAKDAPNILWITTDQQRWNTIQTLGNEYVHTPNLDKLVEDGVSFLNAHCQSTVCTPSRASFLTGMYPSTVRASKNGAAEWPEAAPLISAILNQAGYDCGLSGKLHLSTAMANLPEKRPLNDGYRMYHFSHSPGQGGSSNDYLVWLEDQGYNYRELKKKNGYIPAELHQTTWCTSMAIEFMEERRENPWFFSVNIYDPHGPFDPPQEYIDRYNIKDLPGPLVNESDIEEKSKLNDVLFQSKPRKYSEEENNLRQAKYWAQIDLIDENIERLLTSLKETGQLDNTLIIFTSDHGEMLGDHGLTGKGCRFYEGLVRIPLIFIYPDKFKQNLQSEALVELVDIVPTLLELAGLPVPDRIQGKSLLPILTGQESADHHRDFVRCEFYDALYPNPNSGYENAFGTMIKTDRYKLSVYHGFQHGELFDLQKDPGEYKNLWDEPDYAGIKLDLMQKSFDATVKAIDTGPERLGRY
jgi:arylsulfatase